MKKKPLSEDILDAIGIEAKTLVRHAFRDGPIEDVHAGIPCPHCAGKSEYSHIRQEEMKAIMKAAVDRLCEFLLLKVAFPEEYANFIQVGKILTNDWDTPNVQDVVVFQHNRAGGLSGKTFTKAELMKQLVRLDKDLNKFKS